MSDNKLLAENTIRRFMKLANVGGLAENFVEDLEEREMPVAKRAPAKRGKEKMEEGEADLEENFGNLEEEEEEEGSEEEMEMDAELGGEPEEELPSPDAEPEMGAADMSLTEEEAELLISLGERLSAAMGGAEEEPSDDMGDMDDMEAMGDMEPQDEEGEDMVQEDEDQLVNEVFKRVTKRLVAEKLKNRK